MRQGATRQEVGGHDLGIGPLLIATLGAPVAWSLHLGDQPLVEEGLDGPARAGVHAHASGSAARALVGSAR